MDLPTPPEKNEPAKKKQRSSVKSSESERHLTRSATLTSLQVTSQSVMEYDDTTTVSKDAFDTVKVVSVSNKKYCMDVNVETFLEPLEQDVMQLSNTTIPSLCIDSKKYYLLNLV
jgi:hypothetical protein